MSRDIIKMADGDEVEEGKEEIETPQMNSSTDDENTSDIDSIVDECSQGKSNTIKCIVIIWYVDVT